METDSSPISPAVLGAPAYLSGLTPKQLDVVRTQARLKFAPTQAAIAEDLTRVIERVRTAGSAFVLRLGGEVHKWCQQERDVATVKKGLEASV